SSASRTMMAVKGKTATKKPVKKAAPAKKATAAKTTAKKTAAKKPAKKAAPAKKVVKKKRTPNPAFMKAMQPSEALSKIVGGKPLPRTEITKKLWDYIKKNKLQDAKNKRNINADANLVAVFGGKKQVSMFEMTKLVNKHLS
ncbi:MAG: SWIB/MDM2 domain-containing protein, partial [Nitrospiraceae bacterium]|nr:SWIB/MDM2 domain-containing protein [Nitrospiraceae bacterium]